MFEFIKNYYRRQYLRRFASDIQTGIMPMSKVRSAATLIDVQDPHFDELKAAIQAFYREYGLNGVKGEILFFDLRKVESKERLLTGVQTTLLARDLNWCGRPSREKINTLQSAEYDLFISLIPGKDFILEFTAKACNAHFKIGRTQLPGNTFDMIVSDPSDRQLSPLESFTAIKSYLTKIK